MQQSEFRGVGVLGSSYRWRTPNALSRDATVASDYRPNGRHRMSPGKPYDKDQAHTAYGAAVLFGLKAGSPSSRARGGAVRREWDPEGLTACLTLLDRTGASGRR
jgi:hypothetical protein